MAEQLNAPQLLWKLAASTQEGDVILVAVLRSDPTEDKVGVFYSGSAISALGLAHHAAAVLPTGFISMEPGEVGLDGDTIDDEGAAQ